MRAQRRCIPILLSAILLPAIAEAQSQPAQSAPAPPAQTLAQKPGSVLLSLDDAIRLALQHNHNLLAARSTIQQNEAEEVTANLRPDPVLLGDTQFLPIFQPDQFSSTYVDNTAQFDVGVSYLFERGKKRQHRLQAAKDATAVTRSQVADTERGLTFSVASQYINVELAESTLALAQQDLKSFQDTVDIAQTQYKDGDISEDDLLKIKLQLLQFQSDVSAAQLARAQGLSDLRQLLGYEAVPVDYDVVPKFDYQPVSGNIDDFDATGLQDRPDLRAAQQGVTAANSQYQLQKAIGKRDITGQVSYTHIQFSEISLFGQMPLPIFDRNQGEIARAGYAITQAQEQEKLAQGQVLTDVRDAFENLRSNDQIIGLYRSGYLSQAQQSRDISEYAYRRGAASLLDFLDAERSYRSVQLGYRQALSSYLLAIEQLRQAVGTRSLP
jgi:cobalt-zinc-cadmium efflux system outer membrane protein